MEFVYVIFGSILTSTISNSIVIPFRIRFSAYDFFINITNNESFIRIPITSIKRFQDNATKNEYICVVNDKIDKRSKLKLMKVLKKTSFRCEYEGTYTRRQENTIQYLMELFSIKNIIKVQNAIKKIVSNLVPSVDSNDYHFVISDLIIELTQFRNITFLLGDSSFVKWWSSLTTSYVEEFNYFTMGSIGTLKHIKVGAWVNEVSSLTLEVIKGKLFVSFLENTPYSEYYYSVFSINSTHQYLSVVNKDMAGQQAYIVLVWKASNIFYTVCTVWSDIRNSMVRCNVTRNLPNWDICRCDQLGFVIIEFTTDAKRLRNELFRYGGLTPAFVDIMNVKKLENQYRYGRMGDLLLLAAIVVLLINIFFLILLIIYYHHRWKCFSPTRRQILCLFIMLWLNILLLQPISISYFLRERSPRMSTEYIAWGFLALYSISTYTLMIGGSQVVLFVSSVNCKMWACRFCDFILGFVAIICCSIPLFIFFHSYHGVVVSISSALLLPESYGTINFVLIPTLLVTALCFILSGLSCYLPKRGGGISMMSVLYPLLILHGISYSMVLMMKEAGNTYNYLQYMIYSSGIFFQAIYLMLWLIVLMILPIKKMTIFGKRDCNFRLEYIYLIDLHCPPHEDTNCVQNQI